MATPIRILAFEPGAATAGRLAAAWSQADRSVACAQAHAISELAPLLAHAAADVLILGPTVSASDRADAIGIVRRLCPATRNLVLHAGTPAPRQTAGVDAIIVVQASSLRRVANTPLAADSLLCATDCEAILRQIAAWFPQGSGCTPVPQPLTECERAVARLAAEGLSTKGIAAARHRSPNTVKSELKSAMRKLGFHKRIEFARRWHEFENRPQIHPNG